MSKGPPEVVGERRPAPLPLPPEPARPVEVVGAEEAAEEDEVAAAAAAARAAEEVADHVHRPIRRLTRAARGAR